MDGPSIRLLMGKGTRGFLIAVMNHRTGKKKKKPMTRGPFTIEQQEKQ